MTDNSSDADDARQRRQQNNCDNNSTVVGLMPPPTTTTTTTTTEAATIRKLRSSLRESYPEIDQLYSDSYLSTVLSVPNRSYEYARDEKIGGALRWRREYQVDELTQAFQYDEITKEMIPIVVVVPNRNSDNTNDDDQSKTGAVATDKQEEDHNDEHDEHDDHFFIPSQSLIDACHSGTLFFVGTDKEGRGILHSNAGLLDWWKIGVEDGIRYHILIIEHILQNLSSKSSNHNNNNNQINNCKITSNKENNTNNNTNNHQHPPNTESLVLYVDTSELGIIPPPLTVFTEMITLMQRAYPDRIHKIYIGPVNTMLRKLYEMIAPYLRPRSRDKIQLLDYAPNREEII